MSLQTPATTTADTHRAADTDRTPDTRRAASTGRAARRALSGAAAVVVGLGVLLTALGAGAWAWDQRAARALDARVAAQAAAFLPGGRIERADVSDTPALLAAHRGHVQQAVVDGRSADGHPVFMIVREDDLAGRRAASVSWQVRDLPFAPGWQAERDDRGVALDWAERQVDGHRVVVSAQARQEGSSVVVSPGTLSVDGAPVALQDAPQGVRNSLRPLTVRVPLPDAGAAVRSVWFDAGGVGIELRAEDVPATGVARG